MGTVARIAFVVLAAAALLSAAWAGAAIWFDGPSSRALAGALALGYVVTTIWLLARVRPRPAAIGAYCVLFGATLAWWFSLAPSNERKWIEEVSRVPTARLEGDLLTIENVRDFRYRSRTDFTERWETRTYDLSKLVGFDVYLSYWGPTMIAHTFSAWEFEDSPPLAISIETRKETGESYSAVKGFFRQFELYYVVADERDLAGQRASVRDEQVYLYRLRGSREQARALLMDYVDSLNRLAAEPVWYNALVHNCTTSIEHHVRHVIPRRRWDWRVLINGYIDQAAYEHGTIATDEPFEVVRRRSNITERARAADGADDFWQRIRADLPARPMPRDRP